MAGKKRAIVTEDDKEMLLQRYEELKSENEARWKQMQDKMHDMDQLTKDLDAIKANLHVQTERINECERQLKEGRPDMKMVPMLEDMRDEMEKMKVEQTRLALKANDDSEVIYTVKGRADTFIQLLEQQDEKTEKKLNEHKTNINTMMDVYKNQLEDVKTTIASIDAGSEKEPRAVEQMENKVLEMRMKDLQMQYEWLNIMKQHRNGERHIEVAQTIMNGTEGDLRLNMDNQIATINKQLETVDNNRVAATIDNGAATDDNQITMNNNLATIEKKVDANDKRIATTDEKVEAIDNQITDIDKEVMAMNKRLTWMENWQKKLQNIGLFGTLSQRNGCLVSEFTFTVKNIGEEINKAIDNEDHRIESEPFYTNIMGYRVKIMVYPNESKSNHVGVFLSLVKGEFDDSISWPFICKYSFSSVSRYSTRFASYTINPKSAVDCISSFLRPLNKNSDGYGTGHYISIQKLLVNQDEYLIDGGLNIKALIWLDN